MNNESIIDILKKAMGQYGGTYDDSMYTPEGGRSRLGMARKYGIEPESMAIDTLSFLNPANYMFKITGKNVETGGGQIEQIEENRGYLPLKQDVDAAIQNINDLYARQKASVDLKRALGNVNKPPKVDKQKQMMMEALGMSEAQYDDFLRLKDMMKNR